MDTALYNLSTDGEINDPVGIGAGAMLGAGMPLAGALLGAGIRTFLPSAAKLQLSGLLNA